MFVVDESHRVDKNRNTDSHVDCYLPNLPLLLQYELNTCYVCVSFLLTQYMSDGSNAVLCEFYSDVSVSEYIWDVDILELHRLPLTTILE